MKICVYSGKGTAKESLERVLEILKNSFEVVTFTDGVPDCDVIVVPGGSASEISIALGEENLKKIESAVREGAIYVGICAGAYLAIEGYWVEENLTDRLVLVKTRHPDIGRWRRGRAHLRVRIEDHPLTSGLQDEVSMWYENGPLFDEGDYETIGVFMEDVNESGSSVSMIGSPAIIHSRFGKGDAVLFSPHPEFSGKPGEIMLVNAVALRGEGM